MPSQPTIIHIPVGMAATQALDQLSLNPYRAAITLHAGAAEMTQPYLQKLAHHFTNGLARFANDHHILVADGGTESGGMKLMGTARRTINGNCPLVGVAVAERVTYPSGPPPGDNRWLLNPDHSHFLLIEDNVFGAESSLLVDIATARPVPGLALIVNGGQIVKNEVVMHLQKGTRLLVVKGSGRYADELASQAHPLITVFDSDQHSSQAFYKLLGDLIFTRESRR